MFGCFCSGECMMAYNDNLNDYKTDIRRTLIRNYLSEVYGVDISKIIPAYSREILLSGAMTIKEFRDKNLIIKKDIKMKIPPVAVLVTAIETSARKF